MKAPHDAGLARPCLRCGSTGGYVPANGSRAARTRGFCTNCATWHRDHGTIDQFPRLSGNHLVHPVIPRQYLDPFQLGCLRDQHAVLPGYDWEAVWTEALAYAERWLADPGRRARAMTWVWAQADEVVAHLLFGGVASRGGR